MTDRPIRLDDFGDVLTEADLCALMQWKASTPRQRRDTARKLRVAPDLPQPIGGWPEAGKRGPKAYRYYSVAVDAWLRGETVSARHMRRAG